MAQFTKQAIINAFITLLNSRALDQITVTDIAKKCGISRRTFYHYYQDIYQLPEELLLNETRKVLDGKPDAQSWEDWFLRMMEFALQNKTAVYHIYDSVRREYLERYVFSIADKALTDFIASRAENADLDPADIEMLAAFYTSAVVGLALNWIRQGMREDPAEMIHRLVRLLGGTVQCALNNCRRIPK